ncbi:MAG: acetolactate synthase small subunit [Candidatus Bathyarchaeia archaeon]|jgi:acetolactate synthase-1/3 small subunit
METRSNRVVSAIVENKPGVLHSVANLFRRRNFNIESITVGATEQPEIARITITVNADEKTLDQVVKQLDKLVDVVKVTELNPKSIVTRELALIKVHVPSAKERADVISCVHVFRGRVVDVSPESLMVEITGTPDKIDAFLNLMRTSGVIELARTGITALSRGPQAVNIEE